MNSFVPCSLVNSSRIDSSTSGETPPSAVDEVHVPRRAAELAVRGRPQPDVLLQAHHLADRVVLHRPQLVGLEAAGGVLGSRARSRRSGRSRLPTWSARNGGSVRGVMAA